MAHSAKGEDMRGDTHLIELRRQYHCAAYNALIAIISCTQSEMKFYQAFLFTDNPTKVGVLCVREWGNDGKFRFVQSEMGNMGLHTKSGEMMGNNGLHAQSWGNDGKYGSACSEVGE